MHYKVAWHKGQIEFLLKEQTASGQKVIIFFGDSGCFKIADN